MPLGKRAFLNALGTVAYVSLVAAFMYNASRWFGEADTFLSPIIFLTLFVLSASVTGGLVMGKPLLLYLSGQRDEAVRLFIYTVLWLAAAVCALLGLNFL